MHDIISSIFCGSTPVNLSMLVMFQKWRAKYRDVLVITPGDAGRGCVECQVAGVPVACQLAMMHLYRYIIMRSTTMPGEGTGFATRRRMNHQHQHQHQQQKAATEEMITSTIF
eukprot:jgi/Psemu1/41431/gm1.41431_g